MNVRRTCWSLALCAAACSGDAMRELDVTAGPEALSSLDLFDDIVAQTPSELAVPYDVNAVLYADEAEKLRFMALPEGQVARADDMGFWDFPDGARFVKTFFYYTDARDPTLGRRLLETRIIERAAGTWTGRTYAWNDEQTEAYRLKTGKTLNVQWIDSEGTEREQDYRVPNDVECKTCHSKDHRFEPLGPRTRQLNRSYDYPDAPNNQIDYLTRRGWVRGSAEISADRYTLADPYGDAPLEARARAYLDANCSHCHRPGGEAGSTALDLRAETELPYSLGVCRTPVAAGPGSGGLRYDIVPGAPDESILVFRMTSEDPQLKMPELPTLTSDERGTQLIRAWIASLPAADCGR